MGVSTKAIIRKGTTLKEISDVLSEKYKEVQIISTHSVEYFIITFLDGDKRRGLNVFTYNTEDEDIDGVRLSLGMWGDSVEIMKYILNVFGGYIDENDCDDEGYYSVNIEAYEKGNEFTEFDLFKNKVIQKLGYSNLNAAIQLFEEFKELGNE